MASKKENDSDTMSPITFRISFGMLDLVKEMVDEGLYSNRAELIRDAIEGLINFENKLDEVINDDINKIREDDKNKDLENN